MEFFLEVLGSKGAQNGLKMRFFKFFRKQRMKFFWFFAWRYSCIKYKINLTGVLRMEFLTVGVLKWALKIGSIIFSNFRKNQCAECFWFSACSYSLKRLKTDLNDFYKKNLVLGLLGKIGPKISFLSFTENRCLGKIIST